MKNGLARAKNPGRFNGFLATGETDSELFCYKNKGAVSISIFLHIYAKMTISHKYESNKNAHVIQY